MTSLSDELRQGFAEVASEHFGLHFPPSRANALDEGVRDAMAGLGLSEPSRLLDRARRGDDAVLLALADALTVGETYFLRDPQHFALLRDVLAQARHPMRLWSAGCASGAEPYSMAIIALEVHGRAARSRAKVLGTDLSVAALTAARRGVYRPWAFRGTPKGFRDRWFEPVGGEFRVRDEVRELVEYRTHNLLEPYGPTWPTHVDVIFCRNVLVYFDDAAISHAAVGMLHALAPDGLLVAGPSDPLLTRWGFDVDPSAGFILYRRAGAPEPAKPAPEAPPPPPPAPEVAPPPPAEAAPPEPEHVSASERARRLADRGDTAGAMRAIDEALRLDPLDAHAYLLRAQLGQASGHHHRVLADARRALMLDRNLVYAHIVIAPSAWALSQREVARLAVRNAREALRRMPPGEMVEGAGASASELLGALTQMERGFDRSERG